MKTNKQKHTHTRAHIYNTNNTNTYMCTQIYINRSIYIQITCFIKTARVWRSAIKLDMNDVNSKQLSFGRIQRVEKYWSFHTRISNDILYDTSILRRTSAWHVVTKPTRYLMWKELTTQEANILLRNNLTKTYAKSRFVYSDYVTISQCVSWAIHRFLSIKFP